MNFFSLCNPADFFPIGRFHYEAILEGDTQITRDLGIPLIFHSQLTFYSQFLKLISFLEYSCEIFQSMQSMQP